MAELDPEAKTLFHEAALGKDAEDFFRSDIGRYMVGCAQQEYALAVVKIKTVAPWRFIRIRELQNEMWRAEKFMEWLRDLLIQGKAAEITLREDEE